MSEPEEFKFVNWQNTPSTKTVELKRSEDESNLLYRQVFDLGQEVSIEKRTVLSLPQIFGDLGGLYEFASILVIFLIGRFQSSAFDFNQIGEHYRIRESSAGVQGA